MNEIEQLKQKVDLALDLGIANADTIKGIFRVLDSMSDTIGELKSLFVELLEAFYGTELAQRYSRQQIQHHIENTATHYSDKKYKRDYKSYE